MMQVFFPSAARSTSPEDVSHVRSSTSKDVRTEPPAFSAINVHHMRSNAEKGCAAGCCATDSCRQARSRVSRRPTLPRNLRMVSSGGLPVATGTSSNVCQVANLTVPGMQQSLGHMDTTSRNPRLVAYRPALHCFQHHRLQLLLAGLCKMILHLRRQAKRKWDTTAVPFSMRWCKCRCPCNRPLRRPCCQNSSNNTMATGMLQPWRALYGKPTQAFLLLMVTATSMTWEMRHTCSGSTVPAHPTCA